MMQAADRSGRRFFSWRPRWNRDRLVCKQGREGHVTFRVIPESGSRQELWLRYKVPFLNIAKTFESQLSLSSFSSILRTGNISWQFITLGVSVPELSRQYGERQVVIYVHGYYFVCTLCDFDYRVVRVLVNRTRDKQQTLRKKSCSNGSSGESKTHFV
jgi:hypothetical protein